MVHGVYVLDFQFRYYYYSIKFNYHNHLIYSH